MMRDIFSPLILQGKAAFQGGVTAVGNSAGVEKNISIGVFVGILVQAVLQIVGIVFLILIVYGGFRWMSASGQQKQIEEAQKTIIHSVIGLLVVILAYGISIFVMGELRKALLGK